MNNRKSLILDTSVLLYDKQSIHSFPGNDIILPLVVLDELDKKKESPGLLGENARYVNRYLDSLRAKGSLQAGIILEETNQSIRVLIENTPNKIDSLGDHLDPTKGDNMIIAAALSCKESSDNAVVKVVTKDINLRVKCDALGIQAEDYYKDHVDLEDDVFKGVKEIDVDNNCIDELYTTGVSVIEKRDDLYPNMYVVCKGTNESNSALAIYNDEKLQTISYTRESQTDVKPRNKEQKFALHALRSESIPLVSLTGLAGSGKTFLALMAGIDALFSKKYERIVVTRSIQPVGRDIGFLPGDINEKMSPWMSPLMDNFKHHFKDKIYFECMIEKGEIEIAPLSFIRGRTFNNSYIIVDEAQNATIHELKTIITRIGENSKVVLMGDTDQIDTPYIDKRSNGLAIVIEKFKTSNLSAHVHLCRGERSAIATYASKVL